MNNLKNQQVRVYTKCANCGKQIWRLETSLNWVHDDGQAMCPSPGFAKPVN